MIVPDRERSVPISLGRTRPPAAWCTIPFAFCRDYCCRAGKTAIPPTYRLSGTGQGAQEVQRKKEGKLKDKKRLGRIREHIKVPI